MELIWNDLSIQLVERQKINEQQSHFLSKNAKMWMWIFEFSMIVNVIFLLVRLKKAIWRRHRGHLSHFPYTTVNDELVNWWWKKLSAAALKTWTWRGSMELQKLSLYKTFYHKCSKSYVQKFGSNPLDVKALVLL